MGRSERRNDPSKELERLEKRHQRLKARVAEYESQLTLTTSEQLNLQKLKKEKLATKDAIQRMTVRV
ncbi:MAG: YdcH family protein [Sandaracinaceae bacterium]|nr:YdcH family protein [Sandaracinaceae bacterium]MCC6875992.1 YdcH family protein [Sandaracinaceae bacterium]